MKIGKAWRLDLGPASADQLGNRNVLIRGLREREAAATVYLDAFRKSALHDGIASCIARSSDSLAAPTPDYVIGTRAYEEFREWAQGQDLLVDLAPSPEGLLLLITPAD